MTCREEAVFRGAEKVGGLHSGQRSSCSLSTWGQTRVKVLARRDRAGRQVRFLLPGVTGDAPRRGAAGGSGGGWGERRGVEEERVPRKV